MNAKLRVVLQAAVLLLAGAWVYGPALRGPWVSDDTIEIIGNADLRDAAGLARIWRGADSTDYLPLKSTVQWCEWHLWGDRTMGYHLVNLALHLAAACLFWRLLFRLGLRWAWIGGLIFAVHPLAVESVAWISELKNTLSLPLLLLAMLFYIRGRARGPFIWSIVCFAGALLAKSSVVMFPAVLLLYAWWRHGRIGRRDLLAALPFAALSLGLGLATVVFQQHRAIRGVDLALGGPLARTAAAGLMALFYLAKSAAPAAMSFVYPRWHVAPPHPVQFLPWLALAAGFAWILSQLGRREWARHAVFGLGWFLLNLAPVLGLVQMAYLRISWTADHFAYVPLLGVIGLFAALGGRRAEASSAGGIFQPSGAFVMGGMAVAVFFLAGESRRHAGDFRGEERLWTATLRENPGSGTAHNNLGVWLLKQHRPAEAAEQLRRAVEIDPAYPEPRNNLGEALQSEGDIPGAIAQYRAALGLSAEYPEAAYNLGLCLFSEGRLEEAIAAYRQAVRLRPDFAEARNNLGVSLAKEGRFEEALVEYREALRARAGYAEAENNLGLALAKTGRMRESIPHFEAALRLDPGYAEARHNLQVALARLARPLGR